MIKFLVVCFLLGTLQQPSKEEAAPQPMIELAWALNERQGLLFGVGAAQMNLYFPDRETFEPHMTANAYFVIWHRAQGRPLSRTYDRILGTEEP